MTVVITMQGTIVHAGDGHLNFRCDYIGPESISHLKRMIELNLGDQGQQEHKLSELLHSTG